VAPVEKNKVHARENGQRPAVTGQPSTEFTTDSYQDPKPAQSEHGGNDRFDPKREIVPDGLVEPLVVEKDDEGGDDAEEVHDCHHFLGRFWVTVDDV